MTETKVLQKDLTTGNVPRQLITFAAPLFMSGFLQTVYSMADMVIVGHFVGKEGLSAVAVGSEVLMLLGFIAMGISNAGQILIAQYLGAKDYTKISQLIGTLFTFLLSCGTVFSIAAYVLRYKVLEWINMPPEAYKDGYSYITVCTVGLIFTYGYNLVSAILRGMGDSKHPFYFIAIASILNIVLDLVFILVFKLGTMGAALATILGQALSFLFALWFLYTNKEAFGFDFKAASFKIRMEVLRPLIILGIPMILQSAAISFSKLFITSWINSYGVVASAVSGIGNKLQACTNVFAQALATSGGSMIAQNIGAKKYDRIPQVVNTSFVINGVITLILTVVTIAFPKAVFGIFTDDPKVLAMAITFIPVAVLLYASCVLRPPMNALINGTGNYKLNLAIGLLDGLAVRIGLAYVLGKVIGFGIWGFWYGNALSSFMPFIIGMPYYLSGSWRTKSYFKR